MLLNTRNPVSALLRDNKITSAAGSCVAGSRSANNFLTSVYATPGSNILFSCSISRVYPKWSKYCVDVQYAFSLLVKARKSILVRSGLIIKLKDC